MQISYKIFLLGQSQALLNELTYTDLSELTPEIMHEFIEKIVVHAPDKSSGRRKQKIEIHLRFKVAVMDAVLDCKDYDKKRKIAQPENYATFT